jgi:hypothetical protein
MLLVTHLGSQGTLLSMITDIYILFGSVSTAANVLGNDLYQSRG